MKKSPKLITLSHFLNHAASNYKESPMPQESQYENPLLPDSKIRHSTVSKSTLADLELWESLPDETRAAILRLQKDWKLK
jgi:hypothetical protein